MSAPYNRVMIQSTKVRWECQGCGKHKITPLFHLDQKPPAATAPAGEFALPGACREIRLRAWIYQRFVRPLPCPGGPGGPGGPGESFRLPTKDNPWPIERLAPDSCCCSSMFSGISGPERRRRRFRSSSTNVCKLLEYCRTSGLDVVHVRAEFEPDGTDWMAPYRFKGRNALRPGNAWRRRAALRSGKERRTRPAQADLRRLPAAGPINPFTAGA